MFQQVVMSIRPFVCPFSARLLFWHSRHVRKEDRTWSSFSSGRKKYSVRKGRSDLPEMDKEEEIFNPLWWLFLEFFQSLTSSQAKHVSSHLLWHHQKRKRCWESKISTREISFFYSRSVITKTSVILVDRRNSHRQKGRHPMNGKECRGMSSTTAETFIRSFSMVLMWESDVCCVFLTLVR